MITAQRRVGMERRKSERNQKGRGTLEVKGGLRRGIRSMAL